MMKWSRRLVVHVPRRFTHRSWGGTERVLEKTLPLLSERGFQAAIYTSQGLDERAVGEVAGVPITRFSYFYPEWPLSPERKLLYDNKGGNTVSPALAKSIGEAKDLALVHCHTGNILGAQCLRQARARGVPTVLTLHGGHFAIPTAELSSLAYKEEDSPRGGLRFGRFLSLALGSRSLISRVDAVVCVGVEEFEAAQKALPEQKFVFLPGGVDVEEFARADGARGRQLIDADPNRPLLVCVARIDRQKDQATLVKAWARHLSTDCDLALVGPETSPGYLAELEGLARGARGKLLLPGGVAPEDVSHVYAAADVSVLPSRHEPFGLTCLESWAAGSALVGAAVGGPKWLLEGEREGRLFPVGDERALGRVLDGLLTDEGQRRTLVEAGKRRVRGEFTWEVRARKLGDLYTELLEQNKGKKSD